MAHISVGDILRLASLSKLELADDELHDLLRDLNQIIEYVEQLSHVDIEGLEPTFQVTGLSTVTRPDEIVDYGPTSEELMHNVPDKYDNYIKTKRILN